MCTCFVTIWHVFQTVDVTYEKLWISCLLQGRLRNNVEIIGTDD
jgi:hypothetical protein